RDLTLWEVDEAANRVRQEVDPDANIIVGATFDEALGDKVRVSIVASGMGHAQPQSRPLRENAWAPRPRAAPPPAPQPLPPHAPPPHPLPSAPLPSAPLASAPLASALLAHDYRLRLSEAMDDGNGPRIGPHAGDAVAAAGWRPGNVYITERPPQLSPLGHARGPENRARITEAGRPPLGTANPRAAEPLPPP